MNFNYNTFAQNIDTYDNFDVSDENNGSHGWVQWSESSSTSVFNQVLEFKLQGDELYHFRTWHHEISVMKENGGMIVSSKIDYERNTGDDHIILITGYDQHGVLNFAQTSIQFHGASDDDIVTDPINKNTPYLYHTDDTIIDKVYWTVHNAQSGVDYGGTTDNGGRKSFPEVIKRNMMAIQSAVTL